MAATLPSLVLRTLVSGDEAEFLAAHRATSPLHPSFLHFYEEGMPFDRYLQVLEDIDRGVNLPTEHHVPTSFLFAFMGERIVGRASIRHRLNERLLVTGGHIGYAVVPEFRRRGCATAILARGLEILRHRHGVARALVTCDDDNLGSIKVIERNGGVLQDIVRDAESAAPLRRYWIGPGAAESS